MDILKYRRHRFDALFELLTGIRKTNIEGLTPHVNHAVWEADLPKIQYENQLDVVVSEGCEATLVR